MPVKKSKIKSQKSKAETSRLANARSKSKKVKSDIVRAKSRTTTLSIPVYSLTGRAAGTMSLPKEIFGAQVNKNLLAQALRVYLNNQKTHWASTKTRSEVTASTRKIWRQKGTGRARHGAISAPIFIGGGIALGPKPRKTVLDLPKKMKKKALLSALAQKMVDQEVLGLSGLQKTTGKTKQMAEFLKQLNSRQNSRFASEARRAKLESTLIVTDQRMENAVRAASNIPGVDILPVDQLNAFEVIKHQSLILTKEAVEKLQERLALSRETKLSTKKETKRA